MKIYMTCIVLSGLGLFAAGMQLGFFGGPNAEIPEEPEVIVEQKPATPRAVFPKDLAPAAKTQPVAVAASFEPGDRAHKIVFFDTNGKLHPWHAGHEGYNEEWYTERVEETELVVVVGGQRKISLGEHHYVRAPSITRYQYELEAAIIEAKTGQVLANRKFQNIPRQVRQNETFSTTAVGAPVSYHTVFRWASGIARFGPPALPINTPIVVQLKD